MIVTGDYSRTPPWPDIDYRRGGYELYLHSYPDGRGTPDLRTFASTRLVPAPISSPKDRHGPSVLTSISLVPTQELGDEVELFALAALSERHSDRQNLGSEPAWGLMLPLADDRFWLLLEVSGDNVSGLFLDDPGDLGGVPLSLSRTSTGPSRTYRSQAGRLRAPRASRPAERWLSGLGVLARLPHSARQRLDQVLRAVGDALRARPRKGRGHLRWRVVTEGSPDPLGWLSAFTGAQLQASLEAK